MASTDNQASIALLRRLRAGGDDVHFVHRVDVCAAPPEVLVADLEPVPGTGLDDGGKSRVWYFYHAKRYKNSRGDSSGHRLRAVTGGGGTGWYSEIGRKAVEGSGGGTFCTLTYGLKKDPSARSMVRMGWCMVEYDFVAADKNQQALAVADDSSNYVLCKVYRSSRAKGKPESASSSTSSKKAASKQTAKKRKAGGGDHPEAPPAKLIQQQEPQDTPGYYPMPFYQPENAQVQPTVPGDDFDFNFNFDIEDIDFYLDDNMLRDEPEPGLQQPTIAEPEHDGRFIQLPCGPVLAAEATIVGDMVSPETAVMTPQRGVESEHQHGDRGLNREELFTADSLLRGEPQQPIVAPPPGRAEEFIQRPFGPVAMYGQWSGGMTTATARSIPWSSYAPTSSLYTGCNSLLQGTADPLRFPYLAC